MALLYQPRPSNVVPGREAITCWAKCDMLSTVSLARLDRFKVGRGQYVVPNVASDDFVAIRRAVAKALDLTHIQGVPLGDL